MIILAIDPSIDNTGWAALAADEHLAGPPDFPRGKCLQLVEFGVIRSRFKDPYDRLLGICNDACNKATECRATDVVIETTSGKVGKTHKGGGAGLSMYGVAVGALVMALDLYRMVETSTWLDRRFMLHRVLENLWTGGVPKARRNAAILAEFDLPKRTPHHILDATGLGAWWYANRKLLAG